jgi:hypothetical protein
MQSLVDAMFTMANRSARGWRGIAEAVKRPESTVRKEFSPNIEGAKVGACDLLETMILLDDFGPLNVMNAECGFTAIRLPSVEVDGLDLAGSVSAMMERLAALSKSLCDGGADGSYNANERRDVADQAARLIATINRSIANLPVEPPTAPVAFVREVA